MVANCLIILLTTKTNTTYSHTINPEVGVVDAVPHHPIVTLISVGGMNTYQGISASRVLQKVYFVHSLDRKRCKHWAGSSVIVYKSDPVTRYLICTHKNVSTHCSKNYFAGFRWKLSVSLWAQSLRNFHCTWVKLYFAYQNFTKRVSVVKCYTITFLVQHHSDLDINLLSMGFANGLFVRSHKWTRINQSAVCMIT